MRVPARHGFGTDPSGRRGDDYGSRAGAHAARSRARRPVADLDHPIQRCSPQAHASSIAELRTPDEPFGGSIGSCDCDLRFS